MLCVDAEPTKPPTSVRRRRTIPSASLAYISFTSARPACRRRAIRTAVWSGSSATDLRQPRPGRAASPPRPGRVRRVDIGTVGRVADRRDDRDRTARPARLPEIRPAAYRRSTSVLTAGLFHQLAETDIDAIAGSPPPGGGDALNPETVRAVAVGPSRSAAVNGYGPDREHTFHVPRHDRPGQWCQRCPQAARSRAPPSTCSTSTASPL